ncbi:deoxyribonucleoside regulator [Microbacterium sp. AG1240]|uniref:sugar-binding transcriptional regulator n=1 Tax=Microbacterium sp. AG1240 TaxID=2183992 RepID=UPI000EB4C930|nr:sugar-binding domain-containing protein [Microbacterium sp. AG1240]RKT35673.1 deoxyribonucleoside regulator [Microbacterium sp. AG1240]
MSDDELLAVRAAELYYQDGKSQAEIAALVGINRWKVGRLLALAKESGIVRIEIVHPRARRLPLERRLRETFGLREAVVVPADADEAVLSERVAAAAAELLASMRPVPRVLGISWGRTLQQIAAALPEGWASGVEVVQINGGVTVNRRAGMASATATAIAQKAGGNVTLLPSPAILEHASTRRAIEDDRVVASILDRARQASALIFSAGPVSNSSVLVTSGYMTGDGVRDLAEKGAVGDIVGRYIDADGNIVDRELDERTLGLTLDDLRAATSSIAVIAGRAKRAVARAVVANRFCTVLVTDEGTALELLEDPPR